MLQKIFLLFCSLFQVLFAEPVKEEIKKVVVLGGGIGGMASALYLKRAGYDPVIIEGSLPGGEITKSHMVQNWPGEIEISGSDLIEKFQAQMVANDVEILREEVVGVDFSKRPFQIKTVSLDGEKKASKLLAKSCVIAMGATPNLLKIPGESTYWGKGVSSCAVCDGAFFKGLVVGVVGGGDAAILEALYLSDLAKKVYLFVRKDHFRAKEKNRVQALLSRKNVEPLFETEVEKILGDEEEVQAVVVKRKGKEEKIDLSALFLAIGSSPNSQIFQGKLKLDEAGYITLVKGQQTSVPGVFAIGDIADPFYKQAICAAADGCKASFGVESYLLDQETSPKVVSDVVEIKSKEQFEEFLSQKEGLYVIDFYATWCGPCKKVFPVVEESAHLLKDKIFFAKVNVDQQMELCKRYQIRAMPTVLLVNEKGEVISRKVGPSEIVDLLKNLKDSTSAGDAAYLPKGG